MPCSEDFIRCKIRRGYDLERKETVKGNELRHNFEDKNNSRVGYSGGSRQMNSWSSKYNGTSLRHD